MATQQAFWGRCPNKRCLSLLYCDPEVDEFKCPYCWQLVSRVTLLRLPSLPLTGPTPLSSDSDSRNGQVGLERLKGAGAEDSADDSDPKRVELEENTRASSEASIPRASGPTSSSASGPGVSVGHRAGEDQADRGSATSVPVTTFSAKAALAGSVVGVALHRGIGWAFAHLLQQGSMVSYNDPLLLIGPFTLVSILFLAAWFGGMTAAKLSRFAPMRHAVAVGVTMGVSLLIFDDRSGLGFPFTAAVALGGSVLEPYIQQAKRLHVGPLRPILSAGPVSKVFAFAGFGAIYFCWKAPWKPAVEILRSAGLSSFFGLLATMARSVEQTVLQRYRDLSAAVILEDVQDSSAPAIDGGKPVALTARDSTLPATQPEEPIFLYLRPFAITGQLNTTNPEYDKTPILPRAYTQRKTIEFETRLASAMESLGPFVALGHPGEQIGAGRILSLDDRWKHDFESLATRSKAILIIPSNTPGTVWEIDWLVKAALISKCIFVMPPCPTEHPRNRIPEMWGEASKILSERGITLPAYSPVGALFRVGENGAVLAWESLSQRSNSQLKQVLKSLINPHRQSQTTRGTRHLKFVGISALAVILVVGIVFNAGGPDSERLRVATALDSSFGTLGVTGTVRLNPKDDRVLEVTAEWMDEAQAQGFIAGFGPHDFSKSGFRLVQFRQQTGGAIIRTYYVFYESWSPLHPS